MTAETLSGIESGFDDTPKGPQSWPGERGPEGPPGLPADAPCQHENIAIFDTHAKCECCYAPMVRDESGEWIVYRTKLELARLFLDNAEHWSAQIIADEAASNAIDALVDGMRHLLDHLEGKQ